MWKYIAYVKRRPVRSSTILLINLKLNEAWRHGPHYRTCRLNCTSCKTFQLYSKNVANSSQRHGATFAADVNLTRDTSHKNTRIISTI